VSVLSWILFVFTWLHLFMHTISRWKSVEEIVHYDLVGLLFFFGVLWVQLVRGKRNAYDLLFVSFALGAVSDLVQRAL